MTAAPLYSPRVMEQLAKAGMLVAEKARKSKFGNKRVEVDGLWFDSAKESRRWSVLQIRQRVGEIMGLQRQVRFRFEINGFDCGSYVADFVYLDGGCAPVVEDVKSDATRKLPLYVLKKKLMRACHGVEIKET